MKNRYKKIILTGTLWAFIALAGVAQAETKIATIDLQKVFDNYYKTKLALAAIKTEAADMDKDYQAMLDNYKKADAAYKQLLDQANDQSVSVDKRAEAQKSAQQKASEMKDAEQTINEFERSARTKLAEKQRIKRDEILSEVRSVIDKKAKAAGYNLVIDVSGESINGAPMVLYTSGETDITETILTQLNATASPVTSPGTNTVPAGK